MPNWCNNFLIMKGNTKALQVLYNAAKQAKPDDQNTLLHFMRPMPDLKDEEWYDWRDKYWNTKWDADMEHGGIDMKNDTLTVYFETAWSPPINAVQYFCNKHGVHGRLHYYEGNMDFVGFFDTKMKEFAEVSFKSHDIHMLIEDFKQCDVQGLEGKYHSSIYQTFMEDSIGYFDDVLYMVKEMEDEADDYSDDDAP